MTLAPPGRFSTTICWPSARDSRSVTIRQMMSGVAPAAVETMTRIGRSGQLCAPALTAVSARTSGSSRQRRAAFILSLLPLFLAPDREHELARNAGERRTIPAAKLQVLQRHGELECGERAGRDLGADGAAQQAGDPGAVAHHLLHGSGFLQLHRHVKACDPDGLERIAH